MPLARVVTVFSGFNPTMVRLRPLAARSNESRTSGFQSHYGAIATSLALTKHKPGCRFNPTMVRLRLWDNPYAPNANTRFNPTMVRLRPVALFYPHDPLIVSIPLWCDCDEIEQKLKAQDYLVSIPLWCDCDL